MLYNSRRRKTAGSVVPLGFVLVVGIVTIGLAVFNSTAIPILSQSAEVDSHRATATDFIRMDATISRAVTTDIPQALVIIERIEYPPSLTPISKPSPFLRASDTANITIDNSKKVSDGTLFDKKLPTSHILFSRNYNFYNKARLLGLEHGVYYTQPTKQGPGGKDTLIRNTQGIINGKMINIIAVDSAMSFSKPSPTQVAIRSDDSKTQKVTIKNSTNVSNPEITLPTRIPESDWNQMLEDEKVANGGYVSNIAYSQKNPETGVKTNVNYVTVTMKGETEYELSMYTVKIDQRVSN